MNKTVFCLRGLPGMGKSKIANRLVHNQRGSVIVSADHFFQRMQTGYQWSADLLPQAHNECFENFKKYLYDPGVFTIVIDNVNYRREHMASYRRASLNLSAIWIEIVVGSRSVDDSFRRNIHSVPRETIQNMADRWEE